MDELINNIINTAVIPAGAVFGTIYANGVGKKSVELFNDFWDLTFGGIHLIAEKKRTKLANDIEDYRIKIYNKLSDIPEENIQEPPLNIIGPALEASKYYIEEEKIREMFANLIAASFDNRKSDKVHKTYVQIIKELTTLDANNLLYLNMGKKPIAEFILKNKEKNIWDIMKTNIFLSNVSQNINDNAISVSNLELHGLVKIDYENYLSEEENYKIFKEIQLYKDLENVAKIRKEELEKLKNSPNYDNNLNYEVMLNEIEIKKGIILLTPLGENFVSICC